MDSVPAASAGAGEQGESWLTVIISAATPIATTPNTPLRILYLSFMMASRCSLSTRGGARGDECDSRRSVARERRQARTSGGVAVASAPRNDGAPQSMLYSRAVAAIVPARATGFARIFAWPRVRFTLAVSVPFGVLIAWHTRAPIPLGIFRAVFLGLAILLVYGWLERWPRSLPVWLPRTVLRLLAIVLMAPVASGASLAITGAIAGDGTQHDFIMLMGVAILFAPWIAIGSILRQRDAFAREQALEFDLARSEFERRESDARLRLLQAQVEPHFLFNTLANVQALVDSGSPQASKVLTSLIAYLRAAVPRMHSKSVTVENEVDLVRAYLDLMQMRIPDRLRFAIHLDPDAARLHCPPMTLLTLVENAVRHGIDPGEAGGRIDVDIWRRDGHCVMRVTDTGVGLRSGSHGLGTGLSTLRERLKLAFGGDARLELTEVAPHGVCAEIRFPAAEPLP
jgi:signal transduction histidine kinase